MAAKQVAANCIIGAGSIFHGRLAVSGSLHIEGKFQGDIFTDGDVVVGPTGQAKTDIATRKVVVAGTFIGNINASEEVYVMQSGKVLGSITTPKLTLEPGVVTSGNVTITSDQPDTVADTVTSAYGAGRGRGVFRQRPAAPPRRGWMSRRGRSVTGKRMKTEAPFRRPESQERAGHRPHSGGGRAPQGDARDVAPPRRARG